MINNRKQKNTKRVVIGITGRLESIVAAFLLKKQGYECTGVAVSFLDQDLSSKSTHFQIEDLDHIAKICQFLEIPFYAVDAKKEYEAEVIMKIVSARLAGESYSLALETNALLLKILSDKSKLLKCDSISTGHFAKVHHNLATGESSLLASSVKEQDQSFLLSLVSNDILSQLELPLSEIGSKEVEKVASLIRDEVSLVDGRDKIYDLCEDYISKQIERLVAPSLKPEGDIIRFVEDTSICTHEGIHQYSLGQKDITCGNGNKIGTNLQIVKIVAGRGSIYVDKEQNYFYNGCYVSTHSMFAHQNRSMPLNVLVRTDKSSELISGTAFFKPHGKMFIRFNKDVTGIFKGEYITVYEPLANSHRVLCAAKVLEFNNFDFYDRVFANPEGDDDEKNLFLSLKSRYGYYF